jgi:hypothetical protein
MKRTGKRAFPRWLFAILAIGGQMASGIYIGIISVEGISGVRIIQAAGFGIFGLLMWWSALSRYKPAS